MLRLTNVTGRPTPAPAAAPALVGPAAPATPESPLGSPATRPGLGADAPLSPAAEPSSRSVSRLALPAFPPR